ncbi:MAG: accessory factor UbiK family protein [Pseudomonadota bacterium]
MQTRHPLFDDLSKIAANAVGLAQGVGEEVRTFWDGQFERAITDMDLVRRDEYDALKTRVQSLEAKMAELAGSSTSAAPKPAKAAKKTGAKSAKNS